MGDLYHTIRRVGAVLIVLILIVMMGVLFTKEPIDEITNTLKGKNKAAVFDGEIISLRDRTYFDEGCREWLKDRIDYEDKNGILDEDGSPNKDLNSKDNPEFIKERNSYLMEQCINSRLKQTYSLSKLAKRMGLEENNENIKKELWDNALENYQNQTKLATEDRLKPEEIYRFNLSSVPLKIRAVQKEAQSSYKVLTSYMPELNSKKKWLEVTNNVTLNFRLLYYNDSLLLEQIKSKINISEEEIKEYYKKQNTQNTNEINSLKPKQKSETNISETEKKAIIDYLKRNKAQQEVSIIKSKLQNVSGNTFSNSNINSFGNNNNNLNTPINQIPVNTNPVTNLKLKNIPTTTTATISNATTTTTDKNFNSNNSLLNKNKSYSNKKISLEEISKITGLKIYNLSGIKLSSLNTVKVNQINLNLMQKEFLNNVNKKGPNKLIGPIQAGPHLVFIELTKLNLPNLKLKSTTAIKTPKLVYKMKNDKDLSNAFVEFLIEGEAKKSKFEIFTVAKAPTLPGRGELAGGAKEGQISIVSPQQLLELQTKQKDLEEQVTSKKLTLKEKKELKEQIEKGKKFLAQQDEYLLKITPDQRNQYQMEYQRAIQIKNQQNQLMPSMQFANLEERQKQIEEELSKKETIESKKTILKEEAQRNKIQIERNLAILRKQTNIERSKYEAEILKINNNKKLVLNLENKLKNIQEKLTIKNLNPKIRENLLKDFQLTKLELDKNKQQTLQPNQIQIIAPQQLVLLQKKQKVLEEQLNDKKLPKAKKIQIKAEFDKNKSTIDETLSSIQRISQQDRLRYENEVNQAQKQLGLTPTNNLTPGNAPGNMGNTGFPGQGNMPGNTGNVGFPGNGNPPGSSSGNTNKNANTNSNTQESKEVKPLKAPNIIKLGN